MAAHSARAWLASVKAAASLCPSLAKATLIRALGTTSSGSITKSCAAALLGVAAVAAAVAAAGETAVRTAVVVTVA
jgi:hypothetical protein